MRKFFGKIKDNLKKVFSKIASLFNPLTKQINKIKLKVKKNRVYLLTMLQLSNKRQKRIYSLAARIAIRVAIITISSLLMYVVLFALNTFASIDLRQEIQIVVFFVISLISIISNTFELQTELFKSKDYNILLPLPVTKDDIFLSKFLVYYISQFKKDITLILSVFIGFGVVNGAGFLYYFFLVILLPFIPFFNVLFSICIATLIDILKKSLNKNSNIKMIVYASIYLVLCVGAIFLINLIPDDIRISQLYLSFVTAIYKFSETVSSFTVFFTNVVRMMYLNNFGINLLIFLVALAALLVSNYFIMKRYYLDSIWNNQDFAPKDNHILNMKESKSNFVTFLKKEFILSVRNPIELIKNYALLLLMPVLLYALNYIFAHMRLSSLGIDFVTAIYFLMILFTLTSANSILSVALTKEGMEFVLIKNAPSDTSVICYSKIFLNFVITSILLIITLILSSYPLVSQYPQNFKILYIALMGLIVLIINFSHMLWSMQIDVMKPRLSEFASTGSINDSINVKDSQNLGITVSLLFGVIFIILLLTLKSIGYIIVLALAIIFAVNRWFNLKKVIKYYFDEIEF